MTSLRSERCKADQMTKSLNGASLMAGAPAMKKSPSGMRFFANAAGETMRAKNLLSRRKRQVSWIGKTFKRGWTCTMQRKEDGQLSPEAGTHDPRAGKLRSVIIVICFRP